jgi:hypothetical protein
MSFRVLSLIVVCFSALTSWGQTSSSDSKALDFNGGLVGGLTMAQIHGDGEGGFDKFGFNFGALVKITNNQKNGIQLSVLYNLKGSRDPGNPQQGNYNTHAYRFIYIDLPVVYNLHLGQVDMQFGLQHSVLISAMESITELEYTPFLQPQIHGFDLGAVVGAQINYGRGTSLFTRLTQSIIPISPVPEIDLPPGVRWNNRMYNMTFEVGLIILILPHA